MIPFSSTTGTRTAMFFRGDVSIPGWMQWILWISLMSGFAKVVATFGLAVPILLVVAFVVVPIAVSALWNTEIGIYIMLLFAFFMSVPNRLMEGLPMGILIDIMVLIMLSGILYRCKYNNDWSAFKSPISFAILLWAGMNFMEFANPVAGSRAAWFYVVRPAVGYMMLFFLVYHSIDTPKKMFRLIFILLTLTLISSAWGMWQANFGYFKWEYQYVLRHDLVHLVFNYGRWRAIGSIGSPAQFGIIMGFLSMWSFALMTGFSKWYTKLFLLLVSYCALMGMVYSGTRSAYVIIPIFYFAWVILSRNKKLYYSVLFVGAFMFVIATMPTNNYHIQRIQSTFKASEDASYQTRARNKKMIYPWILKHPIGGGLGSTGVWGQRFSPGTFLANFPPDSGLIRVAVELGWIGLILFLHVYYVVLVRGTQEVWRIKNKKYKAIVSATICGVAPLLIVEWGQEVVGVFPMSMLFWFFVAIMFRAIYFDIEERSKEGAVIS